MRGCPPPVDIVHGLKVGLFVLGDGLPDRMQIERRMNVTIRVRVGARRCQQVVQCAFSDPRFSRVKWWDPHSGVPISNRAQYVGPTTAAARAPTPTAGSSPRHR
jgi:hypothetical protein